MPVQFLSGGGGGGTSDVRTTFADPLLNSWVLTTTSTTQLMARWTIPANYFLTNDSLILTSLLKTVTYTGASSGRPITTTIRLGTTGTVSDASLVSVVHTHGVSMTTFPESAVALKAAIGIHTIGSSGTASLHLHSAGPTGMPVFFTPIAAQTINTTVPLYLSIFSTGNVLSGTTMTIAPVAPSLIVGF